MGADMPTNKTHTRKQFLLGLVILTSAAFLWMLQEFLLTILLAAVFSGLVRPIYQRLIPLTRGRRHVASFVTLIGVVVLVIGPLTALGTVVINQALTVTSNIQPVVERLINEPSYFDAQVQRIPSLARLAPYRDQLVARAGDMVNIVGGFFVSSLSETTRLTVAFVFHFFIMLYTMFFFLVDGPAILGTTSGYLPLRAEDVERFKERFTSITRATVKGTIVIGIIQGGLSGLGFWLAGFPDVLFWTVVMVVLSILPVVGGALIWVPACLILAGTGQLGTAGLLAGYNALLVGSVDNFLRPRLVGQDTKMHDLVILFSTLGGILVFGPLGFILGPILAGVFVTSWQLFGTAYHDVLEDTPTEERPLPFVTEHPTQTTPEIP